MRKLFAFALMVVIHCGFTMNAQTWQKVFVQPANDTAFGGGKWQHKIDALGYVGNRTCFAMVDHGNFAKIMKSTDDGNSWFSIVDEVWDLGHGKPPDPGIFYSSYILNANATYIAFYDIGCAIKRYYKDQKQQDTFRLRTSSGLVSLFMLDTLIGIATDSDSIYVTKNGWKNWYGTMPPRYGLVKDVVVYPSRSMSFTTHFADSAFFCKSSIDTVNWKYNLIDTNCRVRKSFFLNEMVGWIISSRPSGIGDTEWHIIHKTTDGGITWQKQLDTFRMGFALQDIKFRDKNVGIAVGQFNVIYETTDGGTTWIYSKLPDIRDDSAPTLTAGFTEDAVLVGTYTGTIFRKKLNGATNIEEAETNRSKLHLYPQPATDVIVLTSEKQQGAVLMIEISSITGTVVKQLATSNSAETQVFVGDLPSGVYVLRIGNTATLFTKM